MPLLDDQLTKDRQDKASLWFKNLRDQICNVFEAIEQEYDEGKNTVNNTQNGHFKRTPWHRNDNPENGGGVMSVMKGNVFEKVGVNISTTHGEFSPEFAATISGADKDPRFWAAGISLVAHMHNPLVPAVHMNTRMIITSKSWFGGGADLNTSHPVASDTEAFHQAFKAACDKYNDSYYEHYKKWCDDYFYIKHRKRARGEGGIFYDDHNSGDWEHDFAFTQDVGKAFLDIYPHLVRQNMNKTWIKSDREKLLEYRGLYAEFNLLYDRGTLFGLKTGGNIEAILMSLPPEATWS